MNCAWVVVLTFVALGIVGWLIYRVTKKYNEGEYRGPGPL